MYYGGFGIDPRLTKSVCFWLRRADLDARVPCTLRMSSSPSRKTIRDISPIRRSVGLSVNPRIGGLGGSFGWVCHARWLVGRPIRRPADGPFPFRVGVGPQFVVRRPSAFYDRVSVVGQKRSV